MYIMYNRCLHTSLHVLEARIEKCSVLTGSSIFPTCRLISYIGKIEETLLA